MRRIKPVSFYDLKRIFSGKEFISRLSKAANNVVKYQIETQFSIFRELFNNKLVYGNIHALKDASDSPNSSAPSSLTCVIKKIAGFNAYEDEVFPLIAYHTHTPPRNSSEPSSDDFADMAFMRSFTYSRQKGLACDNQPLFLIGSSPEKDKLDVIVLQEKLGTRMTEKIASEIPDFIKMDTSYNRDDNNSIARLLDCIPELNAALLTYEKHGKGYRISSKELAKLRRFSYAPKMLPEIYDPWSIHSAS